MDIVIDIDEHSGEWPPHCADILSKGIHAVLAHEGVNAAEASVVLANDDFIQTLNRDYRGKDKPTNVLSFPQDLPLLGDLIFAHETLKRECVEQEKSFDDHFLHLVIHGTLHLLGYDHIDDDEAEEMEALEIKLLDGLGVKNPYENS